jgi:very-short-patch-repair endonuclease
VAGRLGVAFRRQVIIGRYIADFAASGARPAVEVDGGVHHARTDPNEARDAHRVVCIPAALVTSNLSAAVGLVRSAVVDSIPSQVAFPP